MLQGEAMLLLFVKSYLSLFITVGVGSIFLFIIGIWLIIKLFNMPRRISHSQMMSKSVLTSKSQITSTDIRAIAGGDELSTQLDLVRAYIEVGKTQLAKKMLDHILHRGNDIQQREAKELMGLLKL